MLPYSLSTLTQLTQLNVCVGSQVDGICDIFWLYALTNLKQLALSFRFGSAVIQLHNALSGLARLTSLSISTTYPQSTVSLDVAWDALPLLKAVHLSCGRLDLTQRILSLTQAADLISLRIVTLGTANSMSMQHLGVLMYGMALECPGVHCIFGPELRHVPQLLSDFKKMATFNSHTV